MSEVTSLDGSKMSEGASATRAFATYSQTVLKKIAMNLFRWHRLLLLLLTIVLISPAAQSEQPLNITWRENHLTITGEHLPGKTMKVFYIEAYCRPGSTDRDWGKSVIGHTTEMISTNDDHTQIKLRDKLNDGVTVDHTITATHDEIDFHLVAHNPTDQPSLAQWAQPCIQVPEFTGCSRDDAGELVPEYSRKCFLFIDGEIRRMPTQPWAENARYTPGQVYCPLHVDRNDVNPRPLSTLVPSIGLTGCYSADEKMVMACCWEPYQEIFLGVITCIHNDFRLGGLEPGEKKIIRGKMYFVPADIPALLKRFSKDFPEQAQP